MNPTNEGNDAAVGGIPRVSRLAVASLVCGILGFLSAGIAGVLGVVFGHVSMGRIKRSAGALEGRGLAIAGLVTGYVSILAGMVLVVVGGAIFAMRGIGDAAKLSQVSSDCAALGNALQLYKLNSGRYPTTQQGFRALVEQPGSAPVPRRWSRIIERVPLDPWHHEYIYRYPGRTNATEFEIVSKGPDGQEGTEDDISSQDP